MKPDPNSSQLSGNGRGAYTLAWRPLYGNTLFPSPQGEDLTPLPSASVVNQVITLVFSLACPCQGVHQEVLFISSLDVTEPHLEKRPPFWGCPSFPCILSRHYPTEGCRDRAEVMSFQEHGAGRGFEGQYQHLLCVRLPC